MISNDYLLRLNQIDLHDNEEHYILVYNDKYFYTSHLIFNILLLFKNNDFVSERFKKEHELNEQEYFEISALINEKLESVFRDDKKREYVNFKITLLSEQSVNKISEYLLFLFEKATYVLPITIVLNILLVYELFQRESAYFTGNYLDTIITYFSLFFILLFHEFGHSAALKNFNIRPLEIGFGIYLVFPVLFSNVTRAWLLKKNQRLIVNLSGVYFQMVASSFLVIFLVLFDVNTVDSIISSIAKANFFVFAYSLFPFIRNDGYWALSDSLNIPDLNKQSFTYPIELFRRKVPFNPFLTLYSIGQFAFLGFMLFRYVPSIPQNYSKFYSVWIDEGLKNLLLANPSVIFHFVLSSVILYSLLKALISWIKKIRN